MRFICSAMIVMCAALAVLKLARADDKSPAAPQTPTTAEDTRPLESIRGRIVWWGEALKRRHGIVSDADGMKSLIAIETPTGELIPLVKDARGRGFYIDPRLHKFDYELLVRRFPGVAAAQVVRVYTFHDGKKYEFDYWCDICAIPMYELKDCECCQGEIRFRERLMGPNGPGAERNPGEAR